MDGSRIILAAHRGDKFYYPENTIPAFVIVDKLVAPIEEYGMTEKSMMNSFSAKILEYIYKKYKKKFPIHGQGIYKCRRSCDLSEIDEAEIFDWCCLYPENPDSKALDFKENFDYCKKTRLFHAFASVIILMITEKLLITVVKCLPPIIIAEATQILSELKAR